MQVPWIVVKGQGEAQFETQQVSRPDGTCMYPVMGGEVCQQLTGGFITYSQVIVCKQLGKARTDRWIRPPWANCCLTAVTGSALFRAHTRLTEIRVICECSMTNRVICEIRVTNRVTCECSVVTRVRSGVCSPWGSHLTEADSCSVRLDDATVIVVNEKSGMTLWSCASHEVDFLSFQFTLVHTGYPGKMES
jgi:hypothetical protein